MLIFENDRYELYSDKSACFSAKALKKWSYLKDRGDQPVRWSLQHGRLIVFTKLGQSDPQSKEDSHKFRNFALPYILNQIIMAE